MTPPDSRIDALLDAIDNYASLPPQKQAELEPLYQETLQRFKELQLHSAVIRRFLGIA